MLYKSIILFLLLVISFPVLTFSSPLSDCKKEFNTKQDISKCLDSKLKKAEKSLDEKVAEIRQKMEKRSIESNQIYPIRSFNLSQQSYLIYRKTNCNWYFDKTFPEAGSSELLKDCLIKMTLDRILELSGSTSEPDIKTSSSKKQSEDKEKQTSHKTGKTKGRTDDKSNSSDNVVSDNADGDRYNDKQRSSEDANDTVSDNYVDDQPIVYDEDLDERCFVKPDPGNCDEYIMKYFFYADGGNCSSFIWSGCGGVVPFETMAECREACQ